MYKIYIVFGVMIGIFLVFKLFVKDFSEKDEKEKPKYKYKRKDFLITRAEHEFFDVLIEILSDQYHVFTQVHLPTILEHKIVGQNWKAAFRHINEKSVDFVICDKQYLKPLLAIELDDKSHEKEYRIERDINVEQIFKEADMPLLRIQNYGSFNKDEIKSLVLEKIK